MYNRMILSKLACSSELNNSNSGIQTIHSNLFGRCYSFETMDYSLMFNFFYQWSSIATRQQSPMFQGFESLLVGNYLTHRRGPD